MGGVSNRLIAAQTFVNRGGSHRHGDCEYRSRSALQLRTARMAGRRRRLACKRCLMTRRIEIRVTGLLPHGIRVNKEKKSRQEKSSEHHHSLLEVPREGFPTFNYRRTAGLRLRGARIRPLGQARGSFSRLAIYDPARPRKNANRVKLPSAIGSLPY